MSFETFNEHVPGSLESTSEVSGLFTENKEEVVKIETPTVVEKVDLEEVSYKKINY